MEKDAKVARPAEFRFNGTTMNEAATGQDPVTTRLKSSRIDLLDLSLRNPLLNYRPSTRRGLEVIDEKSVQLFSWLVLEGKTLRIHHTKKSAPEAEGGEGDVFFLDDQSPGPAELGVGKENTEGSLATPYSKEVLASRLLATASDAWLTIQEQGVNTLFLALGMLQWKEEEGSEDLRLAPLVLVPARLERKTARSFWQLSATDEDAGVNLSLIEKLKERGIRLPPSPPLETAEDLEKVFATVEGAITEKAGWSVARDRVALGFFSFGKFLMYKDLDPEAWPAAMKPGDHPLLGAILRDGFRDRGGAVPAGVSIDAVRPPGRTMEVMDADGSQAEALAEVAAGRSLVIQGPPGTGKSQTISNLIAEAVHGGKRVLFVAEKLAALEVVKRRLEAVGLGELCLELHSNKASKKEVAAEVARTLALGKPAIPAEGDLGLSELRDRLNKVARAAADPVGNSEVPPYHAVGVLERLGMLPKPPPKMACPPMSEWTRAEYDASLAGVQDLAAKIGDLGVPARHPFDGCGLVELMPGDLEKIEGTLKAAAAAGKAAREAGAALATALGVPAPLEIGGVEVLIAAAGLALEAPDLRGIPPIGPAWDRVETVQAFTTACVNALQRRAIVAKYSSKLIAEAWDADVLQARADLMADGGSWWRRLLSGRYKAARRKVQGLCTVPAPSRMEELVVLTDRILEAKRLRASVAETASAVQTLAGIRAGGADAPWEELQKIRDWALKFRALLAARKLPASLGDWVVGAWDRAVLGGLRSAAEKSAAAWRAVAAQVRSALALPTGGAKDPEALAFAAAEERAEAWRQNLPKLPSYVAYWRLHQAVSRRSLGELTAIAHEGRAEPAHLALILEQTWARTLLDRALRERPELREFDAVTHEQLIQRFRKADEAIFAVNRIRLAKSHWEALPAPVAYGQVGTLRRECAKKTRHLPIRRLIEQAGAALQAAKPVFLMSPLSVAAYLPPGGPTFDLVVFDEASQVRPVDALGSVLRGRQLVVVGDEKQLPPTSFFDTMVTTEGVTEGEEDGPGTNVTQDVQSILGLCAAQGMLSRMLRWHYRSRHDSLIALSNREFYDNGLVIFPSPSRNQDGEGLSLRHLPTTVYDRGVTRTNPLEADAVAAAVLDHARTRPSLTLGVVAFSQAQKIAIENRIEALARKHADFDAWVRGSPEEPFFVKNLENVQGDERDVMFISVGYGRDAKGAFSMNLGPLNQAGGERRLNVLITRARRRCVVFTNLTADDLDLRRAGGAGIRAFKSFLAFAKAGRLEVGTGPRDADPEFEAQVHAALTRAGYTVETQVGSGGYRLDLAVVDPASPGKYLLGIECDGPRYHGARWARDRDRLREAVLRGLGWRLHRIWSADWQRNRDEALRRCVAAIETSKAAAAPAPAGGVRTAPIPRTAETPTAEPPQPYRPAKVGASLGDTHLAEVPTETVAQFVGAIVEDEGPVHAEEVKRRVLEAIQARSGSKRDAAIEEAIAAASARGLLRKRGDFLWPKKDAPVVPRDRSGLPDASRRHELVCDEECLAALDQAVAEACGCDGDEAAAQAIRLLGIKRNDEAVARMKALYPATKPR
jgi:very-short-patch-repair endonuclease